MNFMFPHFLYNIYCPMTSTGRDDNQGGKYDREPGNNGKYNREPDNNGKCNRKPGNNKNAKVEGSSYLASALSYTDDAVALVGQQSFNVRHQAMRPIKVEVHLWDEANVHHACKCTMHACRLAAAASCDWGAIYLVWLRNCFCVSCSSCRLVASQLDNIVIV